MMTSTSSSSASASASASGGFSVAAVEKKLKDLNTTIQSIQGVSQWLIHYRKYAKTVISVWYKEMHKGGGDHNDLLGFDVPTIVVRYLLM